MTAYVALLRAVNVGGTGKLPMATLVQIARDAGLERVGTYIASGNLVFESGKREADVREALAERLSARAGRPAGVLVRTAAEMAGVLARNPFPDQPANRVMALFTDEALPADPLGGATGHADERIVRGERELFVFYPGGMARTRLKLPAEVSGTARNMNTVAKLAEMAAALA